MRYRRPILPVRGVLRLLGVSEAGGGLVVLSARGDRTESNPGWDEKGRSSQFYWPDRHQSVKKDLVAEKYASSTAEGLGRNGPGRLAKQTPAKRSRRRGYRCRHRGKTGSQRWTRLSWSAACSAPGCRRLAADAEKVERRAEQAGRVAGRKADRHKTELGLAEQELSLSLSPLNKSHHDPSPQAPKDSWVWSRVKTLWAGQG